MSEQNIMQTILYCNNCGKEITLNTTNIESDFIFCPECGNKNDFSSLMNNINDGNIENGNNSFSDSEGSSDKSADPQIGTSPFSSEEDTEKISQSDSDPSNSPFNEIEDEEDKKIDEIIGNRAIAWRNAIKNSANDTSVFTDNFAHGMPEWDLNPPDMLIRRKAAKINQ